MIESLADFLAIAIFIKIATDNVVNVIKARADLSKYKLVFALVLTAGAVFTYNKGVLSAFGIEGAGPYFHYYDLVLSTLFLTSGAQAIHKFAKAWNERKKSTQ